MQLSKSDIAAIGNLVGKDYQKPGKPKTTHLTKEKKARLLEASYQLWKELEGEKNLKRPGRKYEVSAQVSSNPSWVADHDIWEAAKAKAPGAPWGVITNLYKEMGGRIFKKDDFANEMKHKRKAKNYHDRMRTAGVKE